MSMSESGQYDLLDQLAEEFADRFRRGERPALKEYTDRYPELADDDPRAVPGDGKVEQAEGARQGDGSANRRSPGSHSTSGADRRLPDPPRDRPGRHGRRLRGRADLAGPPRGAEGPAAAQLSSDRMVQAALPPRGAGRGPAAPHQHRAGLRGRRAGRGCPLLRDAVHPGPGAGRGPGGIETAATRRETGRRTGCRPPGRQRGRDGALALDRSVPAAGRWRGDPAGPRHECGDRGRPQHYGRDGPTRIRFGRRAPFRRVLVVVFIGRPPRVGDRRAGRQGSPQLLAKRGADRPASRRRTPPRPRPGRAPSRHQAVEPPAGHRRGGLGDRFRPGQGGRPEGPDGHRRHPGHAPVHGARSLRRPERRPAPTCIPWA